MAMMEIVTWLKKVIDNWEFHPKVYLENQMHSYLLNELSLGKEISMMQINLEP
jgi:hypothetical protein